MNSQPPNVAELEPLLGSWRMDAVFPDGREAQAGDDGARTVFEYGPGSAFVIQRWQVPHPAAPDGIAIITVDPEHGGFLQHYFDSRGVVRLYRMTFAERVWTLERTAPDFSALDFAQRFEGRLSDDGRSLAGAWLDRTGGGDWSHDFSLTYTRAG